MNNPFVTNGYVSPVYFCDREKELPPICNVLWTSSIPYSAIDDLLDLSSDTYDTLLYQMPEKQRALFMAIASANKAKVINGSKFLRKYHLPSASSVASAAKGLLEKDFITNDKGTYQVYDIFFKLWLQKNKLW